MKHLLFTLFIAFISLPALAQETNSTPVLKEVEAEYVCMVNDTLFEKPQIPVQVGEKTYYGCCAGCVAALQNDDAIRVGIDPVSGAEVDKTEAVIGADADYKVYYFENRENLKSYKVSTPADE